MPLQHAVSAEVKKSVGEDFCVFFKDKSMTVSLKGVVVAVVQQLLYTDLSRK